MARAAIILAILAVVLNAQCFGACIAGASQQSKSCHHNQKTSVERCEHTPLISAKETPSAANPLVAATLPAALALPLAAAQNDPGPLTQSPSPPHPSSITILKI